MKALIIYGSQYGTAKRYAEKFSEMTGLPVVSYKDRKNLAGYDAVIHFGGLYAGGVKGLKDTVRELREITSLIIVMVGLADVTDKKNIDNIQKSVNRQIPERLINHTSVFHVRGGIDYQKLNFKHRAMMMLLYQKAKNLPEEKKTAEVKAMIETFNSKADLVDFDSLSPIIEKTQQELKAVPNGR